MRTFKRTVPDIKTSDLKNYGKYFNQMQFKGILEDDNIYAIDQESFRDTKNVYVDWNDRLVSRPTLQKEKLPENAVPYQYELDDIINTGAGTIYISKSTTGSNYYLVALHTKDGQLKIIQNITKYHISIIEHYIICFNNVGAKIFDTNEPEEGWQDFNNFVEIPVIKRVVGTSETIFDKNNFTSGYKEEYIWSNESHPILPTGNPTASITTETGKQSYQVYLPKILPEYRLTINREYAVSGDQVTITTAKNIICYGKSTEFYISYNGGRTFTRVYYPIYSGEYLNISSVSEDGQYFFFVASSGVYRCNLADLTWASVIKVNNLGTEEDIKGSGVSPITGRNRFKFKTGDTFCFVTWEESSETSRLYFKGPGLYMGTAQGNRQTYSNQLGYITVTNIGKEGSFSDTDPVQIYFRTDSDGNTAAVIYMITNYYGRQSPSSYTPYGRRREICVIGGKFNENYSGQGYGMFVWADWDRGSYGTFGSNIVGGSEIKPDDEYPFTSDTSYYYTNISGYTFEVIRGYENENGELIYYHTKRTIGAGLSTNNNRFGTLSFERDSKQLPSIGMQIEELENTSSDTSDAFTDAKSFRAPIKLSTGYLYTLLNDIYVSLNSSDQWYKVNKGSSPGYHPVLGTNQDIFYYITAGNGLITTNDLQSDTIVLTYTYNSTSKFTKVPTLSYSDTELYLVFDNLLQITQNNRDGTKILFNLPDLNNQSFIDNITAMINISTTEVALFFENKIVICSKVEDTNLTQGYRYDYYNTKLSTGVRYGDTVMNTLEGSLTIFPTRRGLAVMNYQAFMATTDQVIEYITDNVKDMWLDFFNNSTTIKIIQWRNRLIFTNQTNIILLYDLTRAAWWKWEVPIAPKMATTDQVDLKLVDTTLNIFKSANQYYDFGEVGEFKPINWYVISQPLHMSAPNYYKNLRQLVFQFSNDNLSEVETKSMNAQIKLYRKKVAIKEPHTIQFKIENLRTFVKRFNYWKINEIQWALENDADTNVPKPFELNGISIKYELGDEVR